jgi:16S rRNA C967 or C1407 C5-methylase (RsmB/RsmF family)
LSDKPPKLLKLAADLFSDSAEQEAFADSVLKTHPYRPALVWTQPRPEESPFKAEDPHDWQPEFVDRLHRDQRPGQHDWHDEGQYYCLTFSSVMETCVMGKVPMNPPVVIDLCASPGGKSVMASQMLDPGLLISNEVIGKRTAQLISNLRRCRIRTACVTSLDSVVLAERCPATADLVIVDAPCSGQSLIAKGKHVNACFHSHVINHNRNRQRRILLNAAKLVKPGGWLAYMTCTYAEKENEGNLRWLLKHQTQLTPEAVPALAEFQSHLADLPCYRMWPHHGLGAGGFTSIFRNHSTGSAENLDLERLDPVWKSDGLLRP